MNFIKLYCLFSMLSLTCAAIIGVNMYGLETEYYGFSCDWSKSVEEMVMDAKNLGFNTTNGPICIPVGGFRFQSSSVASPQTTPQGIPTTRMIDGNYVNFLSSRLKI